MNRSIKFFSLLLALALLLPMANAFNYQVEPVVNTISPADSAVFKVTVTNDLQVEDYFTVSTRDVNWVLSSNPPSEKVSAGGTATFTVELTPKTGMPDGNVYIVPVKIKSEST